MNPNQPTIIDIAIDVNGMHSIDIIDQADSVAAALYELGAEVVLVGITVARAEISDPEAVTAVREYVQNHVRLSFA